jgi:hypothetical protein
MWLKSPVRAMSAECSRAALVSSESTLSPLTPCRERAVPISLSAEVTAAPELKGGGVLVGVVGGGGTGEGGVLGGVVGVVGGVVGVAGAVGDAGVVGEGCDGVGCGREGCDEDAEPLGVRTENGVGLEVGSVVPGAVAVLVGAAGESAGELLGAVTLTNSGSALPPEPGASGAIRFGAPSSTAEPAAPGPPCRIPGAAKAKAAMAAVDRLPMAIGAGRSGLNGLRARCRAL